MNRERARALLPIIEAFADGKTVQRYNKGWVSYSRGEIPQEHLEMPHEWRIKPEPREFWVSLGSHGTVIHHMGWVEEGEDFKPEKNGSLESIKVREVLDDE